MSEIKRIELPPTSEIIRTIENYLKVKPDQTPNVADVPREILPKMDGLPGKFKKNSDRYFSDRAKFEYSEERVLPQEGIVISLQRFNSGFEKLVFSLEKKDENGGPNRQISDFVTSLINQPDASDEHIPRSPDESQRFFEAEKNVFKIRHREVAPEFRNQHLGTKMLKVLESFVGSYADEFQKDKIIIATTAQLDVLLFFLKNGYKVAERDHLQMRKILEFIEFDLGDEPHPELRRSVSNYIIPKSVSDDQFVFSKQKPFGYGVDVDRSRQEMGGVAVTLEKTIPFQPHLITRTIGHIRRLLGR